jgi:hypothetical protein
MRRVGVFCGATAGRDPAHAAAARRLGALLATRGIGLVTGGGRVGLMGVVAGAALDAGGEVVGVIPRMLVDRELAHPGLTQLIVVGRWPTAGEIINLPTRSSRCSGGIGTLDASPRSSWAAGAPCQAYWPARRGGLLVAARVAGPRGRRGYVTEAHRGAIVVAEEPTALLDAFGSFRAPGDRWVTRRR